MSWVPPDLHLTRIVRGPCYLSSTSLGTWSIFSRPFAYDTDQQNHRGFRLVLA